MLYLNPPYHIVNGICLFSDHADPMQYYFLPVAPHITTHKDEASGKNIPHIQVIKYRGRAGNGGFLSFDVNLGVPQDVLEDVRREVKKLAKLSQPPRLAPVPLVDGTVKMMLLGAQTGDVPSGEGTAPKFVVKIMHNAKPALYGDNQAAFSVQLDQSGITVLEKALMGEMSPIGIVYSLDFLALRPAYSVRLNIDWDRVQSYLDERYSASVLFSSVEIDKTVDELVDKRLIVLEADTFVPDDDTTGVISRRDQAMNEVRDMITNAFFEPSISPTKPGADDWDRASALAQKISTAAVTGGWGGIASFSYKKTDYKRIDRKILNVNISERTTVKRTINPQGHLIGLFRIFEQEHLDKSKFLISVDLDDKWFERRRVEAITNADFTADSIGSINVMMRYGNEPKNVLLEPAAARKSADWGSIINNDLMEWKVPYSYSVNFKGVDSSQRPLSLTSPEKTSEGETLPIDPRELYSIVPVPIMALSPFPWQRFPQVEVQVRYIDEANAISMMDTFILQQSADQFTWKMFVRSPDKTKFSYRLIYRAANHKDIALSWVETEDEQVRVRDPFPQKRTLQVVPSFRWDLVDRVFVDVGYEDKVNHIKEAQSFEFNKDQKATQTFTVDLRNLDQRLVAYKVTVLFPDGAVNEVPQSFTLQDRVIVRSDMKGHRVVAIRPVAADFARKKARKMTVELRYQDGGNGLSFNEAFDFDDTSASAVGFFEYDYIDRPDYEYRSTVRFENGLSKSTQWQKVNSDDLSIPIS